ncbi:fumarate reductase flavoprotein subunit [Natronocella acetinitrilica]|uniref:Fumarate reductase flavoprotein subunit n=1 Tax=Natronocella acetinitrilica TaxID=414046 RepID=A0AAE3KE08_9GAMM|nr:FAD-dependent oxidoreductase [Natronocella acetinitrilica]MCP1676923.1 fumarate reductase flavoprotein subunit [Natronocella acetinitrilica]
MAIRDVSTAGEMDFSLPLLIVGGGACGMVAALAAADAGCEVAVLERDPIPRGNTFMSSGFIPAAGTRFQAAKGISDSVQTMAADIHRKNHDQADPDIVRTLAEASSGTIEWLADRHGIPLDVVDGFLYPGHSVMRMHSTPRRTGEELIACLTNAAEAAGVHVVTNARVADLYVGDRKRIAGVGITRPDGEQEKIGCDALLLACNGFGANPELVARYLPSMTSAVYYGHEGNQGDALLWGEALGAKLADLESFQGHGSLAWPHQTLITWALMMQGGVQVNRRGERFSDEHGGYSEQAARVLQQPEGKVWNIYDERIHAFAEEGFEDYRNAVAAGAVKRADTVAELAQTLRLPAEALEATIRETNHHARTGEPDRFGRRFTTESLLQPPYRAVQVTGALFHTQGGLVIDSGGHVLDTAGQRFPNLFAAGGAARGISGTGDAGYLSGNGLLSAVVMGAIAGGSAARQIAA